MSNKKSHRRKRLPPAIELEVLTKCKRRCCLCFHLDSTTDVVAGQNAHIDHSRNNNVESNLAYLCLRHHDEYDRKASQAKGLTQGELRRAKKALVDYMKGTPSSCDETMPVTLTINGDI